jgi:DNA (cytosine-5)-methyltransferase 1
LRKTRLKKGQRDGRKSLLRIFAQRVDELLPEIVIFENVRGITLGQNRRYLNDFMTHMRRLGYQLDFGILDAANYGVAQHRLRFILVGCRKRLPRLPEKTHSNPKSGDKAPRWKTVRDAIGDLPSLEAGQRDETISLHEAATHSVNALRIIRSVPPDGGGRRNLPKKLWLPCHRRLAKRKQRGAESIYGRMRWDQPSPTITTRSHIPSCGRFVHPAQNRGITLREAARLQSIPDEFEIRARTKDQAGMWIGNAMPLGLAEALGREAFRLV